MTSPTGNTPNGIDLSTPDTLSSISAANPSKLEVVSSATIADLEALRLDVNLIEGATVRTPLVIPIRKPSRQEFVRVRPEAEYQLTVAAISLKDENEFFVLTNELGQAFVGGEAGIYTLFTYTTRTGGLRLWPIRQPDPDGRQNEWHRSAMQAADVAMKRWVRVIPNRAIGGYDLIEAVVRVPDPDWPPLTMIDVVQIAIINPGLAVADVNHPVMRRLAGAL